MTLLTSILTENAPLSLSEYGLNSIFGSGDATATTAPQRPLSVFKLPIEYLPEADVQQLPPNVVTDLELCQSASNEIPTMYECITGNSIAGSTAGSSTTAAKMSRLFTTNADFLKEYQQIITALSATAATPKSLSIAQQWQDLQTQKNFEETYYFMEFDMLKYVNRNEPALQMLYMLNMITPILTLLSPLMVFITPFFMLKFLSVFKADYKISMSLYWTIVKSLIADLAIVKIFRLSREHTAKEILMTIVYALMFLYTNYQNIVACSAFHRKMSAVYDFLNQLHEFGETTRQRIQQYQCIVQHINHNTHAPFMDKMVSMMHRLNKLIENLDPIKERWNGFSLDTVRQIGYTMRVFYELRKDGEWDELVTYLIELNQYMDFIGGVASLYKQGAINMATIENNDVSGNKIKFTDNYYAAHMATAVKNTIKMENGRNMIISGPNASGKTTLMKSVLLNIIFTQQLGVGFYGVGSALRPFKYIHCYLNIPDTSGRDSLFQAEARRCKEILDKIKANGKNASHFVIFDELFSGTNPEEAVKSSTAFIKYLATKNPNTTFMLTTHYKNVCRYFSNSSGSKNKVVNWRMKANVDGDKIVYTYKIEKGVSEIKGGVTVLKDMGYPQELLEMAER